MIFRETKLKGAYLIEPERLHDERGFFARTWSQKAFQTYGLNANVVQCNVSYNSKKGTLRGMHYQTDPFEESKLVRCTRGSIYDVIIDLRQSSLTFKKWISVELTAENHKMLYVPEGFAHGFITLADNTEVYYQMSEEHNAEYARGVRWNDPAFGIQWPLKVSVLSEKDSRYPDYVS